MVKVGIIILSLFIFGFAQASELTDKISRASEHELISITKIIAQNLARDTPTQIDGVTVLTAVTFVSSTKTLIYYYQTTSVPIPESLHPQIINGVCTNEILNALLNKSINFQYYYTSLNSKHLLTLDVKFGDCVELVLDAPPRTGKATSKLGSTEKEYDFSRYSGIEEELTRERKMERLKKIVIYLLIFLVSGVSNLYRVYVFSKQSSKEIPFKGQPYSMVFSLGCLFLGVPSALIYWLVF